jgi:hypothetical protein
MKRRFLFVINFLFLIIILFFTTNIIFASSETLNNSCQIINIKKGSSYEDKAIGIVFPNRIGDLELNHITKFPQPGLGYSLRYLYTFPLWIKVDLYIYNKQLPSIPDGIYNNVVNVEFFAIRKDIENYNNYQNVKKISVGVLPHNTPFQFLWSCYEFFQLPQPGVRYSGPVVSESYLTGFRNHFLKVRATYWKEREEAGRKLTSDFIENLSHLLLKTGRMEDQKIVSEVKRIAILEEKEEWLYVYIEGGITKWIPKPHDANQPTSIKIKAPQTIKVKWPVVSLREGPGMNYKILGELKKGTPLMVLEEQTQWLRVKLEDGREGWVGKATTTEHK